MEQNGGYIVATDAASRKELWILKIYDVKYNPRKEQDVQDLFIESMTKSTTGEQLEIRDEANRRYVVDPKSRTVHPGASD